MMIQKFGYEIFSFLNMSIVYYTIQLVRCAILSYIVFAFVYILQKTALRNKIFLKGALWSLFLPLLFAGRMKFFYENEIGLKLFWRPTSICMNHVWICWLYSCVVFVYAVLLFYKKRRLKKLVAGMEKREVDNMVIHVTNIPVTPFTIGVFRPRIIIPEFILKDYDQKELQTILLHEKTHISLGHLLFYFLWDILRVLLWLNPLLTIGTKFFRQDMEEICDWVTIQRSTGKAYTYGQLLLKSMRVLQEESENFNMFAAFAGDKEYQNIRQRVTRIIRYKPYKRIAAIGISAILTLCVIGQIVWIQSISYDRCNENDNIFIYGYDNGTVTFFDNNDVLYQMISYDDKYVYVDREAFETYLYTNNETGEVFIIFGGFYKLPGFGGGGYSCCYESCSEDTIVQIPYEKMDDWRITLLKIL